MGWLKRWWANHIADDDPDAPVLEPPAAHGCCEVCGYDSSIYLHGRCHPDAPTWAVISGDVLTIECADCGKVVARFFVLDAVDMPKVLFDK